MKRNATAALIGLMVLGLPALAAPPADPAEWAPADALLYFGITDVAKMTEDFEQTAAYELMSDEKIAEAVPSLSIFGTAMDKIKKHVAESLDMPVGELKNPFGGPLAFYVLEGPGKSAEDVHGVFIASVRDKELMRQYFGKAIERMKSKADKHEEVSASGATIHVLTTEPKPDSDDEDGFDDFDDFEGGGAPFGESPEQMIDEALDEIFSADLPEKLALCLADDRLIMADRVDPIRAALGGSSGGRSLADTEDYRAMLQHLRPVGDLRLLVNVPKIIDLAKQETAQAELAEFQKGLSMIGAQGMRSLVGHMRVGASSYDSKFELLLLLSGQRTGIVELLSMPNRPTAPPDFVPADTCLYMGFNLDVMAMLDGAMRMVEQAEPSAAASMRAAIENWQAPDGETVNLRQTLLSHLQGPLTMAIGVGNPISVDTVRFIATLGHRDQNAMTRFFGRLQGLMMPRDVRGTQLYDLMMPPGYAIAPTSDRIVMGSAAAVESSLGASAGQPLAQVSGWKRAARFVPDESWMTVYADNRKMLEGAFEIAKNPNAQMMAMMNPGILVLSMAGGQMTTGAEPVPEDIVKKILSLTGSSVATIATTPEGIRITSVTLKPE